MASSTDDDGFRRSRSIAVLKAAAEKYGWDRRPSPKPAGTGKILTGRGISYAFRGQTVVAQIAEVEVNRETGHVWAKRLVCAHDCGLVVNPQSLHHTIEGAMLHGLSRALHEEVRFDAEKVTSVDWITNPSLTHTDTPAQIDVVLVNGDPKPGRADLVLWSRRGFLQTHDGGRCQCHSRRDGSSSASRSLPRRAGAHRAKSGRDLAPPCPEPPEANPVVRTSRRLTLVVAWKGLKEMPGYRNTLDVRQMTVFI